MGIDKFLIVGILFLFCKTKKALRKIMDFIKKYKVTIFCYDFS